MTGPAIAPRECRDKLVEVFEDLGSIMGLLRETICDAEAGNLAGAKMVADDALDLLTQPNPLRPRAFGGKGAEGLKKRFPSSGGRGVEKAIS